MRRGRFVTGAIAVVAATLLWAPAGLGATAQQISRDLADNGKLDQRYSAADLQRYLQNASAQQYDTPITPPGAPGGNTGGNNNVAGTQGSATNSGSAPLAATAARGRLPFTGLELGIFALVGGVLFASGLLLRSTARQKSRS